MPQRTQAKQSAPAEILSQLNGGYNGYTDPTLTSPKMWAYASNVYSGAFGFIQRCRFANIVSGLGTGKAFTGLKYFAIPGTGSYLLGDINGKLYSYDTSASYAQTQRLNPYVDPAGAGSTQLNGPFSRETLQSIVYEMNGQVKQAGRGANAATIEGWGLDAPDNSPAVTIASGSAVALTSIRRQNNVVTAIAASLPTGATPSPLILNIINVSDASFNGSFQMSYTGAGPYTFTWSQIGQGTALISGSGSITSNITKTVGRSYAWAWENANKSHVSAPSPVTQYLQYANQNGFIIFSEPGTVTTSTSSPVVTGVSTQFTSAWIGRHLWVGAPGDAGRIVSVQSTTQLTLAANALVASSGAAHLPFDPQATHTRLYATADSGATYFRIARNTWDPTTVASIQYNDFANAEPPSFPYTTETAQSNNLPPPIGQFVTEYQNRLLVYGVQGAGQSFFYSNQESTSLGLAQESFAPLNQVTLPMQNANLNGIIPFPGSAILLSDKQDMFRLTGLLTDNTVTGVAQSNAAVQQGATIARLPYALGCASPFATAITPLGGFWLTPNAEIWMFTDSYAPRNLGRPIQDILNSASPSSLNLARMKFYHANSRNWLVLAYPANGATFNNTLLVLDIDLLASNGSPSYFTFDMATNSPSWWVFNIRSDSLEVVYEANGSVRLFTGSLDTIQDADYQGGFGTEVTVPNATVTLHPYGNDSAFSLKRPSWLRFNTNRDPSMLSADGWTFQAQGIDDDFYTFFNPLTLTLQPGVNDSSTFGGNPDFSGGLAFRHSPELFRIGGVNFIMGRRLKFQINFPNSTGTIFQFRSVQIGFSPVPPS